MKMSNLNNLREVMKKENVDYYIIPSGDSHQSEYVPEYYKGRAYVSGFTGSAGTLLVGIEESYLWTDGRYFIQAEKELNGSGIKLMKMNIPGYPSLIEWIKNNVKEGKTLAFDGSTISTNEYKNYQELSKKNGFNIKMDRDLLNEIWSNRPELSKEKIFIHDTKYCGRCTSEKLQEVRDEMKKLEGENYVIASLDDIAWLFNIRGNDIAYNPVALAYALISDKKAVLYINEEKVTNDDKRTLEAQGVTLKSYNDIYEDIKNVTESIIIDGAKVNGKLYSLISEDVKIIENLNITTSLKAVKNEVEIKNMEVSQVRDGVAMVKFIKWLKENVGKINMTEISASDKLEEIRANGEKFKGLSFNTIAGYKDHAAMMHYSATEESQYELNSEGMLLIDSGAQYLDGTTDITRTFILGSITEEEKRDFTLVLKSHIALATTIFLKGTNGCNLDAIARRPLWKYGMDYKCGTGHGVGFFLNVHEGPQGIRPFGNTIALEPGMILTNEPGVYKENKHGIRTENTLLVTKAFKNDEMGEFYKFDTISYCPIDLEGVDVSLLDEEEREWLNNYHRTVYEKLSPYLNEEEKKFLEKETRSI
ncbi:MULTISPECIES: aminopeptidase P family protein [Clostridium]|uniref:aminopeptidase P family protein n=1 Tax=Clostridium TaxID=1485 RepID=UPI000DD0CD30|nr:MULTISPECIES: aminopeptidase P family protein [Clostridium]MBS7129869.1 aminopeptidase P family protein [Clostridium sp.]MDB2076116.1 aminopeptidase P family protein [Clostridium paraputrificum]MDB2079426.1 aminopeptidase P family protein [Clostridium paraputrificum]MDB2084351.1 aminopeptidase P family protein [Clostridium paraputrificum]MDB2098907.1 aminopeptidase P family protein [Clostridium paraputrificum]